PGYVFARIIRPSLNNERLAEAYTDKNLYDKLFSEVSTPFTIMRSIHGRFYDQSYSQVATISEVLQPFEGSELVVKPSTDSGGVSGVRIGAYEDGLIQTDSRALDVSAIPELYGENFIIQLKLDQHATLSDIY